MKCSQFHESGLYASSLEAYKHAKKPEHRQLYLFATNFPMFGAKILRAKHRKLEVKAQKSIS
jgi:hypothetical protein